MSESSRTAAETASPIAPSPTSPSSPRKSRARKSWLSLSRRTRKTAKTDSTPTPPAPPSAFEQHQHLLQPADSLVPIQFAPNRIATLYVTPSDRDLYLAAMAQLDAPPQALPLWADPAPKLPGPPPRIDPVIRGFSPAPKSFKAATRSPKMVMSPGLPMTGLQVREEFRAPAVQGQSPRHALLSLVPNAFLRFTGFPPETIIAVDQAVAENWPMGVWLRSDEIETVRQMGGDGQGYTWKVELHGRAWKRKGSQELDSVRLVLALLKTLGTHGWILTNSVQAAGLKKATHNLLFRHSPETQAVPPAFFAISLPLPDRVSIISPPNKITPALLTAVRDAITANSHRSRRGHSRVGTAATVSTRTSVDVKRVTWGQEVRAKGIKEEGWVHPGVYAFRVAGMRRWLGGRINAARTESLQPQLLLSLISNLSALGFDLTASIPLLPVAKGRDILYFASNKASGFTYLDTFRPDATASPSSRSQSPVLVSPSTSLDPAATAPNGGPANAPPLPSRKEHGALPAEMESAESQRVLPWTSILSDDPPIAKRTPSMRGRARQTTETPENASPTAAPPPAAMPQDVVRRLRTTSHDSTLPLVRGATPDTQSKSRNFLLKKNSIRRRSTSRGSSVDMPPSATLSPAQNTLPLARTAREAVAGDLEQGNGQRSNVEVQMDQIAPAAARYPPPPPSPPPLNRLPFIPGPPPTGVAPTSPVDAAEYQSARPSFESGASIYQDTRESPANVFVAPAAPPSAAMKPGADHHLAQIPLGQPLAESFIEQDYPPPRLAVREPASARRAGNAMVDVQGGIGIPSMYGSLGFSPGSMARSDMPERMSEISLTPPVPPPKHE